MNETERMMSSLRLLSVGDAFGFKLAIRPKMAAVRELPDAPWRWSDDALMASSVVAVLRQHGAIEQDALFAEFVRRYREQPRRGYGGGMKKLLGSSDGTDWRSKSSALFGGSGSYGNGAAMRVPPLGAFFGERMAEAAEQARRSAEITHTHPEGIAGAVAVASASAFVAHVRDPAPEDVIRAALEPLGASEVRSGLERSLQFAPDELEHAATELGNGSAITAQDTVPLCVWWAAHRLDDPVEAMWGLVSVGGDEDTTCAIVGGILGAAGARAPSEWEERVEALPEFVRLSQTFPA